MTNNLVRPRLSRLEIGIIEFCTLIIFALVFSVDGSIQTSLIWSRNIPWSLYLQRLGPFNVCDYLVVVLALVTLVLWFRFPINSREPFVPLMLLLVTYLGIGLLYNLTVFFFFKTFLYDLKVVLILCIPFMFLYFRHRVTDLPPIKLMHVLILIALGNLTDVAIVTLFGHSEYPSIFRIPSFQPLVSVTVLLSIFWFRRDTKTRVIVLCFAAFELIAMLNRLSLSALYTLPFAVAAIWILNSRFEKIIRFSAYMGVQVFSMAFSFFMITNPWNLDILAAKSGGAETRMIQWDNVMVAFDKNIPGFIGKGLGSTWFTYIPLPSGDIYASGTSIQNAKDSGNATEVQFVFNNGIASMVYKWGFIGVFFVYFLALLFLSHYQRIAKRRTGERRVELLIVSSITFFEIVSNFAYIGNMRSSLIMSVYVYLCYQEAHRD